MSIRGFAVPKLTSKVFRADLQALSDIRLREADILLAGGGYDGAIYLAGYAVECAFKACIAKDTQAYEFPDKEKAQRAYTHVLTELRGQINGLTADCNAKIQNDAQFGRDWAIITQWHEDDRYRYEASVAEARDFVAAAHRIVAWIRPNW
jgi:HEPN domain-containing protein